MDNKEHAFKELDFITTTFGSNVMRIKVVTERGYHTDSREFPFITFLEESAFRKIEVGENIMKHYQDGDRLNIVKETGDLVNLSQLERMAKTTTNPYPKCYTLRELINRLEELSRNGKNDDLNVEVCEGESLDQFNCTIGDVRGAYIDTFSTENNEYNFIRIDI